LVVFGYSYLSETLIEKVQLKLSLRNAEPTETVIKLKKAEEVSWKSHDKLENRVEERTLELVKTNEELQEEITERKKAEDALKESEEKYRTILETIEEGYFEVDIAGNITFANDSLCN